MEILKAYKIKKVAAFMLAMALAACSQDQGNYDYHALNEPDITGVAETNSVLIHDVLDLIRLWATTLQISTPTLTSGKSSVTTVTMRRLCSAQKNICRRR